MKQKLNYAVQISKQIKKYKKKTFKTPHVQTISTNDDHNNKWVKSKPWEVKTIYG